jgi:hypothetical protein
LATINKDLFLDHLEYEALFIHSNCSQDQQWEELYQAIELLLADCGVSSTQFDNYEEYNDLVVHITDQAFKSIKVNFLPRLALTKAIDVMGAQVKLHNGNMKLYNEMREAVASNQKE